MPLEIEQKFRIAEMQEIQKQLETYGACFDTTLQQIDLYFNHPSKDFAITDEALRIRQVGSQNYVTYKGPKLNVVPKTRQEIEISLANGDVTLQGMSDIFEALGFVKVRDVKKTRCVGKFLWQEFQIEAALDQVETLGSFLELEIVCEEEDCQRATAALTSLINELKLKEIEKESYLSLLLDKNCC